MPSFQTISKNSFCNQRSPIRLIATDMDGTLTRDGGFSADLLHHLEALQAAGLAVVIVTGRSAGWVSGLAHYLPVVGAIAENGSLYFAKNRPEPAILAPLPDISQHRRQLAAMFKRLQTQLPHLETAADNAYRLTDWTFDVAGLSAEDIAHCAAICHDVGWSFAYSTVQCHIKPRFDKADGLIAVLEKYFPGTEPATILTVGDSPNDESLFNRELFPNCVGVANVLHYRDRLSHFPAYVAQSAEIEGFGEVCQAILSQRRARGKSYQQSITP